jgi:hypothetical protein
MDTAKTSNEKRQKQLIAIAHSGELQTLEVCIG